MSRRKKSSNIGIKYRRTIKRKTRRNTKGKSRRSIKRKHMKRTKVSKRKLNSRKGKSKRRNLRGGGDYKGGENVRYLVDMDATIKYYDRRSRTYRVQLKNGRGFSASEENIKPMDFCPRRCAEKEKQPEAKESNDGQQGAVLRAVLAEKEELQKELDATREEASERFAVSLQQEEELSHALLKHAGQQETTKKVLAEEKAKSQGLAEENKALRGQVATVLSYLDQVMPMEDGTEGARQTSRTPSADPRPQTHGVRSSRRWGVGDNVEVFSVSNKKWLQGRIKEVNTNDVLVEYEDNQGLLNKVLANDSLYLRMDGEGAPRRRR